MLERCGLTTRNEVRSVMLKHYLSLSKPGIICGNLIAAAAGFFLAAKGQIDWSLFIATMLGIATVIASGCAFNNYVDQDIDSLMRRTQNRVLVLGLISPSHAIIFASVTGIIGFLLLAIYTNWVAVSLGILGFMIYVVLYTLAYKRTSVHATAVGSLSGACPPVIGYCAVTNQFDSGAVILLIVFCLWQIPHSYAIAIYRFQDYKRAGIPVLPLEAGTQRTKYHMIAYIIAFILVCLLLTREDYTSLFYAVSMTALGAYWVRIVLKNNQGDEQAWAKKLFVFSIVIICCFSLLISTDFLLQDMIASALNTPTHALL